MFNVSQEKHYLAFLRAYSIVSYPELDEYPLAGEDLLQLKAI